VLSSMCCLPPWLFVCLQVGPGGIKLYRFVQSGTSGSWVLKSSAAQPRFYDVNEDNRGAQGHLHVSGRDVGVALGVDEGCQCGRHLQ
jgi:hypothetical protein